MALRKSTRISSLLGSRVEKLGRQILNPSVAAVQSTPGSLRRNFFSKRNLRFYSQQLDVKPHDSYGTPVMALRKLRRINSLLGRRGEQILNPSVAAVQSTTGSLRRNLFGNKRNLRFYSQQLNVKHDDSCHTPVMVAEVLQYFDPKPGQTFVDMTFGAGGHATRILESAPDVKILALDRDPVAHEFAKELASRRPGRIVPLLGRFSELPHLLQQHKIKQNSVDGFLFDFGCSSMQFDMAERGFSLAKDGPLDMRMDGFRCPDQPTVADVLARADEDDLARILKVYGEEKQAKKIARAIIEARYTFRKLETTQELAQLVASVLNEDHRTDQLGRFAHGATKTFQALRIFVNNELNEINFGLFVAQKYLKIGGRLVTISFHSLEDTIVKRHISGNVSNNQANALPLRYSSHSVCCEKGEVEFIMDSPWKMLHKHVLTPTAVEVEDNPRSRSAKFRATARVK